VGPLASPRTPPPGSTADDEASLARSHERSCSWWVQQPGICRVRQERTTEMRKVTAGLFSTIDGVVQAPDQCRPPSTTRWAQCCRTCSRSRTPLLGRVTFTEWAGYWPTSTDEPSQAGSTGAEVRRAEHPRLGRRLGQQHPDHRPVPEFVADLKDRTAGPSGQRQSDARADPDRARARRRADPAISPVAPAAAACLFPDDAAPRTFELVGAQPTSSGTVIATYRPAR
jgi:hypothetical protein